jgi:pimeloyl-ACP methyl ester carboxylesterase
LIINTFTNFLTIARMVEDGIELVEFLRSRFGAKVVGVGHSWGSVLGIHMIRQRPDLVAAYVGTGQVVNMRRNEDVNYTRQLAQAYAANNRSAVDALSALGPPPFAQRDGIRVLREWADKLAAGTGDDVRPRPSPLPADFSADDRDWLMRGFHFSGNQLFDKLSAVDLPLFGLDFQVPVFFFEGTDDQQTPVELAEEYFSKITAPVKAFVRFEGCHHFVVMNRPDDFLAELVRHVLPVVSAG